MTLEEATGRVLAGATVGEVFPALGDEADRQALRAWFVSDPRVPARRTSPSPPRPEPTGEACPTCGGINLVRTGACKTCQDCGTNGGCG